MPGDVDDAADGAVVLEGDGVVLRCLRADDLAAHIAGEDDDTVRWLTEGRRSEPDRTAAWILENRREWATGGPRRHLGICDASTGVLVGGVEAHLEPAPPGVDLALHVNISYAVFPRWRGRGVAARAVELLCTWLPEAFGPSVAVLRIAPENAPSLRVATACGFERPGAGAPAAEGDDGGLLRFERDLPSQPDQRSDATKGATTDQKASKWSRRTSWPAPGT